jgi:O-antigen/teichoic acid export membrane protein
MKGTGTRADLRMARSGSLTGRIARNTGMLFGGKLTGAILGLLVLIVLGNVLEPAQFGGLLLLHAYAASFAGLASFNSWQMVVNYGVGPFGQQDWFAVQRLMRFAMSLDCLGAVLAAVLAVTLMPFAYSAIGMPDGYLMPAMAYCALIFFRQTSASTGFLRLSDRFDLLSAHTLIMPAARLIGVVICALLGADMGGYIAVWFAASLLSYLSLPLLALRQMSRSGLIAGLFRGGRWLQPTEPGMWRFALLSNLDSTVKTASEHLPTLLAGMLFGPSAAAIYRVSRQIADLFARGVSQFDKVVHPEIARLLNNDEPKRVAGLALKSSMVLLCLGLATAALLALSQANILASLLDDKYGGSPRLIVLLLAAASLMAAAMPFHPVLYASKRPGLALTARVCGISLFLLLVPILAGNLGIEALGWAAIGGELAALVLVLALAVHSLHRFGQANSSAPRTPATTASSAIPEDRSGGPGHAASGNVTSSNDRSSE